MRKYGKRFDELHSWMDEPWEILGKQHRMYRHDPYTTPREAKNLFGEYADHACSDHILLDWRESPQRFDFLSKQYPMRGLPAGICPRCGATLVWRRARLTGELYRGCTNYKGGCRYQERSYKRTPTRLKHEKRKYVAKRKEYSSPSYSQPKKPPSDFYDTYDIGLQGPDDSHFWGPPLKVKRKEKRKQMEKSPLRDKIHLFFQRNHSSHWLRKAPIAFAIAFYLAYFVLCLSVIGGFVTCFILFCSAIVIGIGAVEGGQKRYSRIGGYYWTDPELTADLAVFLFLFCFLVLTFLGFVCVPNVPYFSSLPHFSRLLVPITLFATGLIAALILAIEAGK
ncbi:hypothetical protein KAU55_00325 [Candidatus Bathyarchaeota archaeon]|nr:hypothetical protein [Candidatus Bathyarchaeota archaeon]